MTFEQAAIVGILLAMLAAYLSERFRVELVAIGGLGAGPAIPERLHHRWTGSALGAAAALDLRHTDRARAERLVAQVVTEVDRLEGVFSLQRATSALSLLNRDGRLPRPPLELVAVLESALIAVEEAEEDEEDE